MRRPVLARRDRVLRGGQPLAFGVGLVVALVVGVFLLVGRELSDRPRVVVAAQPTRGLDVQGVKAIQDLLVAERDAGVAILLISEDLDELLTLTDRLLVMHGGRVVAEFDPAVAGRREIGEAMVGHVPTGGASA